MSQPITVNGIIIRDETVYKSPESGNVVYYVNDSEKVKVGTIVASVENSKNVDNILSDIESLDKKIYDLQERRDDYSVSQKDAKRINSQIKTSIDNNIFYLSGVNTNNFYKTKDNIDKKIDIRNQLLLEENNGSLKPISEEKQLAVNNLNNNQHSIKALNSGVVSYYIDGFEETYTLGNMYSLSKDLVQISTKDKTIITNKTVAKDDKVFKVINSNTWYIGAYIDTKFVKNWKESDNKNIYIENDSFFKDIDATIDKIILKPKESYVVFKFTSSLLDYINVRNVNIKISESDDVGLKIPNSALTELTLLKIPKKYIIGEDQNFVKCKKPSGEIEDVLVTKTSSDAQNTWVIQKYSVIQNGDTIVDPNDVKQTFKVDETMNIVGVYKINTGIAKFVQVTVKEQADGFSILDKSSSQGIMPYDVIVTNSQNIIEGQKIYKKN